MSTALYSLIQPYTTFLAAKNSTLQTRILGLSANFSSTSHIATYLQRQNYLFEVWIWKERERFECFPHLAASKGCQAQPPAVFQKLQLDWDEGDHDHSYRPCSGLKLIRSWNISSPWGKRCPRSSIGIVLPKPVGRAHMMCEGSVGLVAHSNMSIWRVRFWGKSYGYQAADEKLEGLKVTWKSLSGGTDGWVSRRFDKALSSATLLSMITLSANQFSIDDAHCTKLAHFFINFQFLNHCSQLTWVLNASQFSFAAVPILTHHIIFKMRPAVVSSSPSKYQAILSAFFTAFSLVMN